MKAGYIPESITSNEAAGFSTWNSLILVEYVVISRAEAVHQCAGAIRRAFHAVLRGSGIISPKLILAHWKWTKRIPDYLVGACQLQRYVALRCP